MKRCLTAHGTNYMPKEMAKKNGRPKVLTPEQEIEVREWLRDPKNRTRYLDDLVWLIHDRFGIVCSTTTMSKLKRKWLRVIEYEETGTPIDDITRSQLLETHPDLPLLHESPAPTAQMSSEDQNPMPEAQLAAKLPTQTKAQTKARTKVNSALNKEQSSAGAQQSQSPTQDEQETLGPSPQSFLQSPVMQMQQQPSPPQQQSPLPSQQNATAAQAMSSVQQRYSPNQPQMSSQQHISKQQIASHPQQYSPLQQQFSSTQSQVNTSQQAFLQSPTLQMQMQAQMMVGAGHFGQMDPVQIPHDFQSDFTGDIGAQHLPA
ncbi:hypothetical protein DOTSEDRAFT_73947 [Dothistroma septosporum NZE10]|uniref:Uncharacterized protein n=1 Tax=Dothistroma septosporum (strain NZE10 / CBS 128990) TaxID=675120 RepID=N1PHB2_DOTSN|nr:hypothetical protein DOTSEDRAFT_73947 [Dothistroma septosporum NZE10]